MPRRLLVCRRWIRGWCWLCAFSDVCCGFMSEQNLNSTRCMSLSLVGIYLGSKCLPLLSMGITNTPSGWLWRLVGRFCFVGKTQSGMFLSMSSTLRSDNFSPLQASIVTIAEPSLPLLISSPQRLTAWWCRFICILFRVWLLHLSMPHITYCIAKPSCQTCSQALRCVVSNPPKRRQWTDLKHSLYCNNVFSLCAPTNLTGSPGNGGHYSKRDAWPRCTCALYHRRSLGADG